MCTLQKTRGTVFERYTQSVVSDALSCLKNGKSAGINDIYGEHCKYSYDKISILLSILFICMMIHGYIPPSAKDTILIPIIER